MPDPKILNPRDAIVRITSTAICGSDLHLYNGFIPTMKSGDILGHEFMGEVVEVGRGVQTSRSAIAWSCRFPSRAAHCLACQRGTVLALRELEPQRVDGGEAVGPFAGRHLRLLAHARRFCRRAGANTCACRSPTSARSRSRTELTDEQVLFLSDIFPTGYMGAEMCNIQPGDVDRGLGLRPGRAVRDRERAAARRRARRSPSIGFRTGSRWRASAPGADDHQLRRGRRPRSARWR